MRDSFPPPSELGPDRPVPPPKRRGRPPGSVSLTDEIHRTIVNLVRAGVFLHVAARAAGIAPRTIFDWLRRAEGAPGAHPATPKLIAFASDVRRAQAEARAGAEIRVYKDNPLQWLRNAARTKGELDGWSEPSERSSTPPGPTLDDRLRELDARDRQEARRRVGARLGCGGACFCDEHGSEVEDEFQRIQVRPSRRDTPDP